MQIKISSDLEISIPNGPIGITCSGGADSSLLLYILMSQIKDPIHIFSGAFANKKVSVIKHTPDILSKCIELTGNTNIYQHIVYCNTEDQKSIIDYAKKFADMNIISITFTGVTSLPPDSVTTNFKDQKAMSHIYDERNPNIHKSIWFGKKFCVPFINFNKQDIAQLYEKYNLLDSLFPLTRSCENTKVFSGHCTTCWWCEERFWGFKRYQ